MTTEISSLIALKNNKCCGPIPKFSFHHFQGKYMDIEFDFKGDPVGGVISNCKYLFHTRIYKAYIV